MPETRLDIAVGGGLIALYLGTGPHADWVAAGIVVWVTIAACWGWIADESDS